MRRALLGLVVMIASTTALAEVRIHGDACDGELLRDRLAALGLPTDGVEVTFEPAEGGARGRLSVGDNERTLHAATCDELEASLAVIITMIAPRSPAPSPAPPPVVQLRDDEAVVVGARAPIARRPLALAVGIGAALSERAIPAAFASVRVRTGRVSLSLEVERAASEVFTMGPGTVTIDRTTSTLAPCIRVARIDACAVIRAGWIRGRGEGYAVPGATTLPMAGAGLGVAWEAGLTEHLAARATLDAVASIARSRMFVDDMAVWATGSVEARLGLSMIATIP